MFIVFLPSLSNVGSGGASNSFTYHPCLTERRGSGNAYATLPVRSLFSFLSLCCFLLRFPCCFALALTFASSLDATGARPFYCCEFSPYVLVASDFDIQPALCRANQEDEVHNLEDLGDAEGYELSYEPTPPTLSPSPTSFTGDPYSSPISPTASTVVPPAHSSPPPMVQPSAAPKVGPGRKQAKKERHSRRRTAEAIASAKAAARKGDAAGVQAVEGIRASLAERLAGASTTQLPEFDSSKLPTTSSGFVGKREEGLTDEPWTPEELLALGLRLHKWDGR